MFIGRFRIISRKFPRLASKKRMRTWAIRPEPAQFYFSSLR